MIHFVLNFRIKLKPPKQKGKYEVHHLKEQSHPAFLLYLIQGVLSCKSGSDPAGCIFVQVPFYHTRLCQHLLNFLGPSQLAPNIGLLHSKGTFNVQAYLPILEVQIKDIMLVSALSITAGICIPYSASLK